MRRIFIRNDTGPSGDRSFLPGWTGISGGSNIWLPEEPFDPEIQRVARLLSRAHRPCFAAPGEFLKISSAATTRQARWHTGTNLSLERSGPVTLSDCACDLVNRFRRPPRHESWTKPFSFAREDRLKPKLVSNTRRFQTKEPEKPPPLICNTGNRRTAMKRPLLMIAFLTLACAATLAPIRSTPPVLLSNADGLEWKCSKSALILTSCTPSRDVRFTSTN